MDPRSESSEHVSVRIEQRVHGLVERGLRRRGWRPRVVPYTGYGTDGWVRVLGRVVLVPSDAPQVGPEDRRGWRRFVSPSAPRVPVTIGIGEDFWKVTADRDGYVDVRLDADLQPGWTTALLSVGDSEPAAAPIRVVGPDTAFGMVSDIDDTVIVTNLPRPLLALRNAFLLREHSRRAVPGMAELYDEVVAGCPDLFVVYLSTGAWNAAGALDDFLARHGYPPGPLLLTDWGPTPDGWFRSGQTHKRQSLRRLFADFPRLRWLLVGDDGQHDPSLYAEAAAAAPDRVLGIAIRQLTATQQVATHGLPSPPDSEDTTAEGLPGDPVLGPDGTTLLTGLRQRGLMPGS